jgi:hypothetical protein
MQKSSFALSPAPSWIALVSVVAGATGQVLLLSLGEAAHSTNSANFWMLLLNTAWSWWVHVSRRRLGQSYAFEFEALVFFAWPVVVPYYLIKSRKVLIGLPAFAAWFLCSAPFIAEVLAYVVLS